MEIIPCVDPFPYLKIKNFYTEEEEQLIWEELKFLTYKNKLEYKSLESKVDKSILSKERYYISGHDVIHYNDYPKSNSLSLDF